MKNKLILTGGKNMGEKLPWYVRFNNFFNKPSTKKSKIIFTLIMIFYFLLVAISGYVFFKLAPPMEKYEDVYDIEFYNYVEDCLKNVSDMAIEEGNNLYINSIPETVLEYEIQKNEQGIKFNYSLDNEKIVSEYYSNTGKKPKDDDSNKEMKMNIQLSTDFQTISTTSSFGTVPTLEQYEDSEVIYRLIYALEKIIYIFLPILVLGCCLTALAVVATIATANWKMKQEEKNQSNHYREQS